jgi:protein ImuB
MSRIACILIPDLPIAAMLRSYPELRERPLALSANPAPHAELIAVSPQAAAAGVRVGMTAAQARAIVPELPIARRSPPAERSAFDALLDAAESVSPLVEAGAPDRAWLDLGGLARLFHPGQHSDPDHALDGSASGDAETAIAAELIGRARRVGLEAAVGIGASKEVAYLAACCGGMRVIAPGLERDFLDWLPLEVLDLGRAPGRDLEQILARWGIRRLGDLARLDPRAVASRLGADGLELVRLARGERLAPFVPRRQDETFSDKLELEYGVEHLEPLGFLIRPMLERTLDRLGLRGLVAGDISLEFGLADRSRDQRRVAIAAATLDVRALLTLVMLNIETAPPAAAVEAIAISVEARAPRPAQSDLFTPPTPVPGRLETTLTRLAALCGPDRVGMLGPQDSWRPEAMHLLAFAPAPPAAVAAQPPPSAGNLTRLTIRAIRPAEEVEVLCDRGTPEFVRGQRLAARVVSIAGPWRREGEWWHGAERALARDYYDLALGDGAVYRAFCDRHSGRWFVDGIYD